MRYVAYFVPGAEGGRPDPTKTLSSRKAAEKYILSLLCSACKEETDHRLSGMNSGCAAEWLLIPEKKFRKSMNYDELMEAAGWKRIHLSDKTTKTKKRKRTCLRR